MLPVQEGGKLLGEGVYGCVFDPPLKCTKRKRVVPSKANHKVGKITSEWAGNREYEIAAELGKLPNAEKYFVLIDEICKPEPKLKQEEPDLPKCTFLKDTILPNQVQITMPFGGTALRFIPRTPQRLDYFKLGQHLLEAGTLLLMQKIVHRDIHGLNILVDSPSSYRLIDFGMAWRPDRLTLANMSEYRLYLQFDPQFSQEPPEITYINGINSNIAEPIIFAQIYDKKKELDLVQTVLGISKNAQIQRLKTFIRQSKSIQDHNDYIFFKLYWSKIDAWSIGALLMGIWTDFVFDPAFEQQPVYKNKKPLIFKILRGLLDCDSAHRLDCAEALALWAPDSPLLQQANVKAWLKEQEGIRAKL
jgi:serine/threonine protein kinase